MEDRKAKKPLNKTASKSASDDLYKAHEDDPRPNALYEKNGDLKRLDSNKNSQAGLRKEWMDHYIAHGGGYEEKPISSASLKKPETAHCPAERNNWVALDYHYNDVELTPVSGMDFCVTCSDGSEINGNLDENGLCHIDNIPEGNVDVEYGKRDYEEELKSVRAKLKKILDQMVEETRQDSAYFEKELNKRGLLERGLIHTGAILKGGYDAGSGTLGMAWYVLKGAKKLEAKLYEKTYRAIKNNSLDEIRDDLGTLQFELDVAWNKVQKGYEVVQILAEDPESRDMIIGFPRRYLSVLHSTDYEQYLGALAFEVLMAMLTGGSSSTAIVAKSRHFSKVRERVDQLVDILKRRRLRKKKFPGQQKTKVVKDLDPPKKIKNLGEGGLHKHHEKKLRSYNMEKKRITIMRDSNTNALQYQGRGHTPKDVSCKAKTADASDHPLAGLVVNPHKHPKAFSRDKLKRAKKEWDDFISKGTSGYKEGPDGVLHHHGDKIYGDYDLHGVYQMDDSGKVFKEKLNFGDGKTKSKNADQNREDLNEYIGQHGRTEHVRHGGQHDWVDAKAPDPPCTAYLPDGSTEKLRTTEELYNFHQKHGLPWPDHWPKQ